MSSRGARRMWATLAVAFLAACHDRSGASAQARARVLARVPDDAVTLLAAESRTLAHPHVRAVIDVLRPRWPARMGCAIDAMFTGEQVAVGIAPRGTTVVIETSARVECPALSNIGGTLWVATIGDGVIAKGTSVLDDPRRARARPYLLSAPLVGVSELAGGRLIATARPEPLEAWLAFDTTPALAATAAQHAHAYLATLANRPVTGPFARRIAVRRTGSQVLATLTGPVDADLSVAVRLALAELVVPQPPVDVTLPCPPIAAPVRSCAGGPVFEVSTIAEAVAPILDAPLLPVIVNTRVRGLRLGAAVPALGLEVGDVLVGAGGQPVVNRLQVSEILRRARSRIAIVVERGQRTSTLSLVGP